MQIKVKSVKVLKTGTGEFGEWKMVGVTTEEGVKYATFAKDADTIPPGSTLNISDMDENEKGKSFKKFEIVQESTQTPAKVKGVEGPEKPPFIDTREASIEAQVAYKGVMENWGKDIPESMKLAAARWGLSKLGVTNMPKIEDCLKDYFKEAPESESSGGWQGKGTHPKGNEKPVAKETPAPAQQEALNEVRERLTGIPAETGRPEGMPAVKTGAELFAYVNKRGISLAQFTAITQAANPNDLKTEEQLIAAWNVLAPKMKVK